MEIIIVGLGPGAPELLTREAWQVIEAADELCLRTAHHPTVEALSTCAECRSFDALYESAQGFPEVYRAIAEEVLRLGRRSQGVVYAVPGHPLVGEATVQRILTQARAEGLPVRIVEGLSFVEPTLTLLGLDALEGVQICDAIELAGRHHPPLNPDVPALIGQIYSQPLASDLKLTLMNQYPDEHPVALVHAAGTPQAEVVRLPLYEIDRRPVAHLTTLYVPSMPSIGSFERLQDTIGHLRSPEGCPWDREQTHQSLRGGLLEEAYEAVEAIDADDTVGLCEELGDLLLQIVFQTQIATEAGDFRMVDVIAGIDAKLRHRHPHVWGELEIEEAAEVLPHWEALKREEKQDRSSLLDGLPAAMPALLKAHAYGERAARVGFDWSDAAAVVDKVREELDELKAARTQEAVEAELGDLLFAVANWARHLNVEPETALRKANARFAARFRAMEALAEQQGRELASMDLDQLEALWQAVKAGRHRNRNG
ncbi:MAG: nucleoside triphosphate pyrophosphohydrolase [Anaerolineae bacterium]|jgi:tetrapyrrole methylase family protein/MazG family protein